MTDAHAPDLELLLAQRDWIRTLARRLVADPHRADDVAQESLLRGLTHPPAVDGDVGRLRGWLARVAESLAYKSRRAETRRAFRERRASRDERRGEDSAEIVARADVHQRLVSAVLELPEPSRSAVLMRYFEGRSVASIARAEGLEPAVVRKRIARGVDRLRGILDARHGGNRRSWCQLLAPLAARRSVSGAVWATAKWTAAATAIAWLTIVSARGLGPSTVPTDARGARSALAGFVAPRLQHSGDVLAVTAAKKLEPLAPAGADRVSVPGRRRAPDDEAVLTVRVVSKKDGEALAGARVLLVPEGAKSFGRVVDRSTGGPHESLVTDDVGVAEVTVPAGTACKLHVNGREVKYRDADLPVPALEAGEEREIVVRLAPGERVPYHVRCVDADTGEAVKGAELRAPSGAHSYWSSSLTGDRWADALAWEPEGEVLARSDEAGHAKLTWTSWEGTTSARIFAPGYGPASVSVTGTRSGPADPKVIRLSRGATVFGYVWDPDGRGVEGVSVGVLAFSMLFDHADGEGHVGVHSYLFRVETDAEGRFELGGLPAIEQLEWEIRDGNRHLYVAPDMLQLSSGERRDLSQSLGGLHTLRGRLVAEDGKPVAGAMVQVQSATGNATHSYLSRYSQFGKTARTDAEGFFAFQDIPGGEWFVGPQPADHGRVARVAPYGVRVLVPGSSPDVVAYQRFIEGQVRSSRGDVLADADVSARSAGDGAVRVSTDEEGFYRLGPLAPGEHRVSVAPVHEGKLLGWVTDEARVAQSGDREVDFELQPAGGISGRAVDAFSGLSADSRYHWVRTGPTLRPGSITMGYAGGFSFGLLLPGTYTVIATTGDGRIGFLHDIEVVPGVVIDELEVPVAPGGFIELVSPGHGQRRGFRFWSGGECVGGTWPQVGATVVAVVPPGTIRVEAYELQRLGLDAQDVGEVEVGVGETVTLEID